MRNIKILLILFMLSWAEIYAQEVVKPLTFSGYIETYYSYDFGNPTNHERVPFFFNYNRDNEVNLNLGFAKVNYSMDQVRGNFAWMIGTYPQYNLPREQDLLKNILEANVGIRISKKHNLWVDAGIMPSHIGFENVIGKDNWNLTRSILGDNTPYYEAGLKVGYTSKSEKLYLAVMYLNGWQRIRRIEGNQTPAFGTQLTYKPKSGTLFNWSTFIGNEFPDALRKWRYFSNLYGQIQLTSKFDLMAGFDMGMQQQNKGSSDYDIWCSPILAAQYMLNDKIRISARGEYYSDRTGGIIPTNTINGFQTYGYSLNFDYLPTKNAMFRVEGRGLSSKDQIFMQDGDLDNESYFITTSIALSF